MRDGANTSYSFGSFRLEVAERQLFDGQTRIPLPPRVFDVLLVLVQNAGHLVEKEELLQTVWAGSFVEEANIARVIHTLRRVLREGESDRAKFIETVAKRGYRFVADVTTISERSSAEITAEGSPARAGRPTNAFQACQLARYHFNQMTPPDMMRSRALLEEALRLDRNYAPAYAALAEQAVQEVVIGLREPAQSYPAAKSALRKARSLDAHSAEYYTAAGFVGLLADWDLAGAERNFRSALQLNPHHAFANSFLGQVFMFAGRPDEATPLLRKGRDLDPMNLCLLNLLPIANFLAGNYEAAVEECDKMLSLYPRFVVASWIRCWALEQMGRADEAVVELESLLREPNGDAVRRWIGYTYARVGDRQKALETAAYLDAESRAHYLSPTHQAQLFAGLGDTERALGFLEAALDQRDPWMLWIGTDPRYDTLRSDPDFEWMVNRVIGSKLPAKSEQSESDDSPPQYRLTPSGYHAIVSLADLPVPGKPAVINGPEPAMPGKAASSRFTITRPKVAVAAVFALIGFGIAGWLIAGRRQPVESPIFVNSFAAERLSADGKVSHVTISPNGKLVIYSHMDAGEMASLWLRNLETGHNREIVAPSRDVYHGVDFAPDGDWFYFVRRARDDEVAGLYRLSIHGGVPEKIVSEVQGWISISQEAVAFVRCHYKPEDNCSLFVARADDGKDERKLVTRPIPFRIRDLDFSPDGKSIAFASGQSENSGMDFTVSVYDLETNAERTLSPEKFFNIAGIAWLPDANSLLITASRGMTRSYGIWRITVENGVAESLTKNSESYVTVDIDAAATRIISTRAEDDFRLRVFGWDSPAEKYVFSKAEEVKFGPNGDILYVSRNTGSAEIWSSAPDGGRKKQLTNNPADDLHPVAAPDTTIYFASNRTGSVQVWMMNADGSDQVQVTKDVGGFPLATSPDGEWIYYHHGTDRSVWRVSSKGGGEHAVYDKPARKASVSPWGPEVAFPTSIDGANFMVTISLQNGTETNRLKAADQNGKITHVGWLPDGRGLAYIVSTNEFRNNTLWIHPFAASDPPQKVNEFNELVGESGGFAISNDGKSYAVIQGSWLHDAVLIKGLR